MPHHIFTYGSLMFAEVWQRLVRGRYRSAPALLAGHARYAVSGATYPGVVPQAGAGVAGVLYFDLDGADLAALDAFEGSQYARRQVTVELAGGIRLAADTYLYLAAHKLSDGPWQPDAFDLRRFLDTCSSRHHAG